MEFEILIKEVKDDIEEERLEAELPPSFLKHCDSHTFEEDHKRSLLAWWMLKEELYKRGINPYKVELQYGKEGKPYIEGFPFNIAHSGKMVVLLISEKDCGVDIERIASRPTFDRMAKKVFSSKENEVYNASKDKPDTFIYLWSRKEAFMKKSGVGISDFSLLREDTPSSVVSKKIQDSLGSSYWLSYLL